ncbi:putative transporter domain protein [Bordetella holmesii 35009]|nr:putative transporter domain protein [Bordetella holmesii 35009]
MLNKLWLAFFLVAAAAGLVRWIGLGEPDVFRAIVASLFEMARVSVEVMVLLFGTLTLWLGFLRIAEVAGLVGTLAGCSGRCLRD